MQVLYSADFYHCLLYCLDRDVCENVCIIMSMKHTVVVDQGVLEIHVKNLLYNYMR